MTDRTIADRTIADRGKIIGEMYGDHAVQASFCFIACKRNGYDFGRTMIGGTILSDFCLTEKWERWTGTAILIPTRIDVERGKSSYHRLDQMMISALPYDDLWTKKWGQP